MNFVFVDLISMIGSAASISGVSLPSLLHQPEKQSVEAYIRFLEPRRVLYAEIDRETKHPVIKSIEEIKLETERLRANIENADLRKILGRLVSVMQRELDNLWSYDTLDRRGQMKMFLCLQRFRIEMAKALSLLCAAYKIDPASTEMQQLIVNMATVRPAK